MSNKDLKLAKTKAEIIRTVMSVASALASVTTLIVVLTRK